MSFITKRERVFAEYCEPVELPARNEGKLKAYSSCTDARAWSHFVSDKSEHLMEIIKRNNEACRGKYVPMNVIIEMMMASKNSEIARLKRKISQFEQMLTAYDQLDLNCEQQCEISKAHAMIRTANKSLEEIPTLDLSGFTEGIDSEGFQVNILLNDKRSTGKSGGDEASSEKYKSVEWAPDSMRSDKELTAKESTMSRILQANLTDRCSCDASTSAHDTRVEELRETVISKDAKLNAMQNTIAVMENDICEPYCVYAHIYTALEKIYATLRQNEKYRLFLDLMSGKDIRSLDIKGRILLKLKILEKFSIALLSPCAERFQHDETCECYTAEVLRVETTFALTSAESKTPKQPETKRAQLVADIMGNDEMKKMLQSEMSKPEEQSINQSDVFETDNCSIDTVNLSRLKNLQIDYNELMTCYENVKHERDNLKVKSLKYEELEKELESLRGKLREYNLLYNEREYYRKRSEDLDSLKEKYLVLADETGSMETQLKAETEINQIKSGTIEDLRSGNVALEKKLSEVTIAFEKEKNSVLCKFREAECKIMCQEQQIKSLSAQIDRLLEQDQDRQHDDLPKSALIMDEIEALKDQIKNLNDALYSSEDEKQQLQDQFEDKLKLINELKMEIEEWRSNCEKTLQRNDYLEKYTEGFRDEVRRLVDENKTLSQDVEEKTAAVANLINVIHNKSQEVNRLMEDIESKRKQNIDLHKQLQDMRDKYGHSVEELENEKKQVLDSLHLAKQESLELFDKVKDYDELLQTKENISKTLVAQTESCNDLRNMLLNAIDENKRLQSDLSSHQNNNSILLQEIQRLREVNNYAINNINNLQNEKDQYKSSYELTKKDSEVLEDKLKQFGNLREQLLNLRLSYEKLVDEKNQLEGELRSKARDLDDAMHSVQLTKKESEHLLEKLQDSESLKEDMIKLHVDYRNISSDKHVLQKSLEEKKEELHHLRHTLDNIKAENDKLLQQSHKADDLQQELAELKKLFDELANDKAILQNDFDNKTQEINNLYNGLEEKIEENRDLLNKIKQLEHNQAEANKNISELHNVNMTTQSTLLSLRRESEVLINKLKNYETLLNEFNELKQANDQIKQEKDNLQNELIKQLQGLKILNQENQDLQKQSEKLTLQNDELERTLIDAKQELINSLSESPYTDLVKEIDNMKNEKKDNYEKIKDLLNKLEEADHVISNLSEDVMTRDDKIAILENHINSLEDEVRRLHQSLAEVVDTGEQIKDNSLKKIDQSLNIMEAHHSKATHNMKMELAQLQNQKAQLEEQLSVTKIKSEESFRDTHKYLSQIVHLQNEREIIVTDIKQLELSCVGDTKLSPTQCSVEEILKSLDKIRKCIDARNSKSNSIEQTLLKVQTSSQLLLSKADEAKKLVEKEKQKNIKEKEEAIADKLKMERQLLDLKEQLQRQTTHDKDMIRNLEAEILNQKLIIDKLNTSTQNYISKLEEELQSLQSLYQNALGNITELQENNKNLTEENSKKSDLLNKVNLHLAEKSKEVSNLQESLDKYKNKSIGNVEVQVGKSYRTKNTKSQTEKSTDSNLDNELGMDETSKEIMKDVNFYNGHKPTHPKVAAKQRGIPQSPNEVQIMTAKVEPSIDNKMKRLQPGNLEVFSIPDINASSEGTSNEIFSPESQQNPNLVDIYNRQSDMHTISSKAGENSLSVKGGQTSPIKSSLSASNEFSGSTKSTDNLFMIYQDSGSTTSQTDKSYKEKGLGKRQPPIVVEAVTVGPNDRMGFAPKASRPEKQKEKRPHLDQNGANKIKQHIEIRLPRSVEDGGIGSYETISVASKEDLILSGDSSPKEDVVRLKQPIFLENDKEKSTHILSRVEADLLLFKKEPTPENKEKSQNVNYETFALEYILDSIKRELDPESMENKKLLKTRSDDLYSQMRGTSDNSPTKLSPSHDKTITTTSCPSPSKWSDHSQPKSVIEQSVMANIDAPDYYENKIRNLSQQLENTERDYKKKLEVIKVQYDNNIKSIINEHNHGVKSIQNLHEETLQDILKIHENEVENLRSMSIDAMRKADKLEKANRLLKSKIQDCNCGCILDQEPIKISSPDLKKRKSKCHGDTKILTKTNVEAFNVKPKLKYHGPCTCSLDVNVSDTIRNIFEQVDAEQRKIAEHAYLKYIANKILSGSVESLDPNELSFLHLKVCRTWKSKITKEEALQKRIDSLENELLAKQRHKQQHLADLDRIVIEQRQRLDEVREAVCRMDRSPPDSTASYATTTTATPPPNIARHNVVSCSCNSETRFELNERRSAGDLGPGLSGLGSKFKAAKAKPESRAVLAKLDVEERQVKKLLNEPPTRLRRDRPARTLRK